jgi:Zn ribbon nucleic-acid-binding protein
VLGEPVRTLLSVFERLYETGKADEQHVCSKCQEEALRAWLERLGERVTLFVECESCGYVDHLRTGRPAPAWLPEADSPSE